MKHHKPRVNYETDTEKVCYHWQCTKQTQITIIVMSYFHNICHIFHTVMDLFHTLGLHFILKWAVFWPLGMKYHDQDTKCWCLVWNESTAYNKKSFHKVWNCCIKVWKKILRYETNFQGMKLLYKGMKKVFKVWNKLWKVWKKILGYEIVFKGMKKYLLGMKKNQFLQISHFIP